MHYCVLLITKNIPSTGDIEKIMQKYNDNNLEYDEDDELIGDYPVFTYDWYQIGGRYSGQIKLKVDSAERSWMFVDRDGRNGKRFHSYLLSKMKEFAKNSFMYSEEDYYPSMGLRDGYLYVDGAEIKDIINLDDIGCYVCIDVDGNAIARESWNGNNYIKDDNFDEKFKAIKESSLEHFATILDIHD